MKLEKTALFLKKDQNKKWRKKFVKYSYLTLSAFFTK